MKKFEQLHAEDQADIALEMMRLFFDQRAKPIKEIAAARDQTPLELWRQVCADVALDECEPWQGYPAGPCKESFACAPGADRPLPEHLQKLLDRWKTNFPHMIGRQ